ncbi:MAG: DUF6807 family protein [bacterium]
MRMKQHPKKRTLRLSTYLTTRYLRLGAFVLLVGLVACGTSGLRGERSASGCDEFRFEDRNGTTLEIYENDALVLGYNYGDMLPAGVPEDRKRSSYIHPIMGLDGERLSDDFPSDHYHHRGLFWAWPHVGIGNRTFDQWHLDVVKHRFDKWIARKAKSDCAVLGIQNGWYFLEENKRIADEKVTITVRSADMAGRIIDVDLKIEATDGPITVAGQDEKGYGGFNFRPAERRDEVITTLDGIQKEDTNLVPSAWGDFSGKFGAGDKVSGVAIFQHPDNPLFPSGWCLRHYGFLGVDFPGIEPFEMRPGKPLHLRYRVWIHRGDAECGKVREMYDAYIRSGR